MKTSKDVTPEVVRKYVADAAESIREDDCDEAGEWDDEAFDLLMHRVKRLIDSLWNGSQELDV